MSQVRVGVGVLVMREGKVLLLRRRGVHGAGCWSSPGGHLDFGESIKDCARRETEEETGVSTADVKVMAITNDIFEEEGSHYITIWVEGMYASGEPRVNAPCEASEVGWFSWQELPEPLLLPLRNLIEGKCHPFQGIPKRKFNLSEQNPHDCAL